VNIMDGSMGSSRLLVQHRFPLGTKVRVSSYAPPEQVLMEIGMGTLVPTEHDVYPVTVTKVKVHDLYEITDHGGSTWLIDGEWLEEWAEDITTVQETTEPSIVVEPRPRRVRLE